MSPDERFSEEFIDRSENVLTGQRIGDKSYIVFFRGRICHADRETAPNYNC